MLGRNERCRPSDHAIELVVDLHEDRLFERVDRERDALGLQTDCVGPPVRLGRVLDEPPRCSGLARAASDLEAPVAEAGCLRLVEIRLFRGAQVGAGKKSLAYQSSEGTLTDRDAAKLRKKILANLEQQTGAVLRG